jgi:diguanylate cyclase (GGDEF)-like protein/PAS domain S-box-containing protein
VAMFDREMRYLAVSDRWRVDFRLDGVELLGRCFYDGLPETADHWREIHRRCLQGGVEQADEDPFPRNDGTLDWVRWEVRPWYGAGGEIGGLLMFIQVITDRKRVEDALRYLATHDHLTGLPNRTAFLKRLERSLERTRKKPEYGFAVFFLDLDDFKEVNDAHGHSAGDELLQQVGERLRRQVRPKDELARFAGDEFVGLIEDTRWPEEARAMARRLLEQLRLPFQLRGRSVEMGCSLGIALSGEAPAAEELLRRADAAMYEAKSSGKSGWRLYEAESADLAATPSPTRSDPAEPGSEKPDGSRRARRRGMG